MFQSVCVFLCEKHFSNDNTEYRERELWRKGKEEMPFYILFCSCHLHVTVVQQQQVKSSLLGRLCLRRTEAESISSSSSSNAQLNWLVCLVVVVVVDVIWSHCSNSSTWTSSAHRKIENITHTHTLNMSIRTAATAFAPSRQLPRHPKPTNQQQGRAAE